MKKIIVTISPDGKIRVEAEGYSGNSCEEATKFLKSLGKVVEENKKPEYYEAPLLKEEVRN
mgnify:CR=1 FL=1|jgi:hypothetical protein